MFLTTGPLMPVDVRKEAQMEYDGSRAIGWMKKRNGGKLPPIHFNVLILLDFLIVKKDLPKY